MSLFNDSTELVATNVVQAIESTLGDRLRAEGVKPEFFGFAWTEVAEREYVRGICQYCMRETVHHNDQSANSILLK